MAVRRVTAHKIGDESYNSIAGGGGQQERNSADIKIHRAVFVCKSVGLKYQPYGERDSRKGEVCHQKPPPALRKSLTERIENAVKSIAAKQITRKAIEKNRFISGRKIINE